MRNNRYTYPLIATICVSVTILGYSVLDNSQAPKTNPNDTAAITRAVPFKVYQPSKLPSGYISENDYAISDGSIISFSVKTPSGGKAVITQQARPAEINSSSFSGLRVSTPLGRATISSSPTGTSAAVITDSDTLILINSTSALKESEIKTILSAL